MSDPTISQGRLGILWQMSGSLGCFFCLKFTFGNVIFDLGSHVRPLNGLSGSAKTTFNSRVCSK